MPIRINLVTPFSEKDAVKALGARWDQVKKLWYIVDVADLCLSNGMEHGLIDLAGDNRIIGPHPDGSAWRVGLRDPAHPDGSIESLGVAHAWVDNQGKRGGNLLRT